ncbi:fibronectin type III domain-containing protein [Paenibacillus sp. 2KB_20]|uniref:fibronectin type III domain-containing protein n=1 Tax=Paenibacillus sp. 2KB_20 TaxID=3232977 RepID=UPI003F97D0AF
MPTRFPSKPGVITGTATGNRIVLSWPAVSGATKYDAERKGTIVVSPTTATATLSSLQPDQDYTIRVRAKNAGGDSEWSDPLTFRTTLSAPTITVTSGVGENTITWSAIGNASEYELDINVQSFNVGNQQT